MADYIHEEIIVNILHRLPVKTLLRCTTVCKSWYTLITTPHFISSHSKFTKPSSLLLRRYIRNSEHYDLYSDNLKSFKATFEFPFTSINSHFTIIGICNGLLCLSDDRVYHMNTIILWNPCIKRSVLLPKPNAIYNSHGSFTQCLGFGFDPAANDYKVVRITYVDLVTKPQIEVYKLSDAAWRDMSYLELDSVIHSRSRQVYVNGTSHWIARCSDSYDLIVLFDMSHDVFRTMTLPASVSGGGAPARSMDLAAYRDSLALVLWNVGGAEQSWCVWTMREYNVEKSWTKNFCLDFSDIDISGFMRPLWVGENSEVVVVRQDGRLISCNCGGGGEAKVVGEGSSRSEEYKRSLYVGSYTDSLVLLERGSYFYDVVACSNLPVVETDYGDSVGSSGGDYEAEIECKRSS